MRWFDRYAVLAVMIGMVLGATIADLVPEPVWFRWLLIVLVCGATGAIIGNLRR